MEKYLIVLKQKRDVDFLKEYKAENIVIHLGIIVFAYLSKDEAERLKRNEYILSVEKDGADHHDVEGVPDLRHDTAETSYAFDFMNISKFHEEGLTGKGFKVALLDTGVQKHSNLNIAGGINVYDSTLPWDNTLANQHGTTVAGVLNAQGLNNEMLGIIPDAELYAVRIDNGNGYINTTDWSSQIAGISWAVENGMDAVNCSFSSPIDSEARKTAFKLASDAGIAIFCSAGNTQPDGDSVTDNSRYPAKYPFVISNANINDQKQRHFNSTVGRGINFSNGGRWIKTTTTAKNSTDISTEYATVTGTSLATPATLGIYILYKQKYGESREKILQRMSVNAEKLGSYWEYGAGLPKYPTKDYKIIQMRG